MSKESNLDEKTKIKIKIKESEAEIPNETNADNVKINIPKVSGSKSNDISRLDYSFISWNSKDIAGKINSNSEIKTSKKKFSFENSNILNLENEIEYIIKKDKEDIKRESNFFSEKALFDEINNAECDSNGENDK